MSLAVRIMVHPTEIDREHELEVRLQGEDGQQIATMTAEFGVGDASQLQPGEEAPLPLPLLLQTVPLPRQGRYAFELLIDGIHQATVPFAAVQIEEGDGL